MRIPNHYTSTLSQLDLSVAIHIPPGGNWKDIPAGTGGKRVERIRVDFAAGKGSRSTYYGRLHPDRPSYTMNTYFNRPGNGCHLHYDFEGGQHRVISEREAARLQSFPDDFVFLGSHRAIQQQIGNAVPPLLAYQVASSLDGPGDFLDLFSGAGGLALGFTWAGWTPLVSNDIEEQFLKTHRHNLDCPVVSGDIRDEEVFARLISEFGAKDGGRGRPLFVLGGPPCQGYSTAGHRRSMDDERNHLFKQYAQLLTDLQPDGFVFENVSGLLNMEGGSVFEMVKTTLSGPGYSLKPQVLDACEFGVPQRRKRIFVVGTRPSATPWVPPLPVTSMGPSPDGISRVPSVKEALSDLPALVPGQDGSELGYASRPTTSYQRLMRGGMTPHDYIDSLRAASRG